MVRGKTSAMRNSQINCSIIRDILGTIESPPVPICPMLNYIFQRLLQSVFVILTVSLIAFSLFRFVGDPVAQMVGQETSIEDQENFVTGWG